MIETRLDADGIRAVDAQKNEVHVRVEGLIEAADGPGIDRGTHAVAHLRGTALHLPPGIAHLESGEGTGWTALGSRGSVPLPGAPSILQVDAAVTIYVCVEAAGTVTNEEGVGVSVSLPSEARVTVGFRSRVRRPDDVITLRRTPTDVARAVSAIAAGIATQTPDRSFPSMRPHPPRLEFADEFSTPHGTERRPGAAEITITVPPTLAALLTIAPLTYYLGAAVTAGPGEPRLTTTDGDELRVLGASKPFEQDVADVLAAVFYLDCLVRNAGPYATDLEEAGLPASLGLDPEALYERPIAARVTRYLELPVARVLADLPTWHLAFYIAPTYRHVPLLSHVLDRLATIHPPAAVPFTPRAAITGALDEGYRGPETRAIDERVVPRLATARLHAWAADGVPVEAFKTSQRAVANRWSRDADPDTDGPIRVALVANDDGMAAEADRADAIYRGHDPIDAISYRHHRNTTQRDLRALLREEVDFLHFIGHCEPDGLQCADGWLATATLDRTNVRTFFLNACRSFREGWGLVERGAIGGGVTAADVLDAQATRVGTTVATLVVHGYSVANAIRLARLRSIVPHAYIGVGDGTYRLPHSENAVPMFAEIRSLDDGRYHVTATVYPQNLPGSFASVFIDGYEKTHLTGNEVGFTMSRDGLRAYLADTALAVAIDDEYHWSTDLAADL